jgi:HSP20 family protein
MAEKKVIAKKNEHTVVSARDEEEHYIRPRTSIYEMEDAVRIIMDVPGVSRENLDIHYDRGEMTITAKRETWDRDKLKSCYCERFDGHYRRVFALDNTLDANKIDAKLKQGVLELTIPKVEAAKPKKIEIKVTS